MGLDIESHNFSRHDFPIDQKTKRESRDHETTADDHDGSSLIYRARAFSVPIESERGSGFYFDAFSSREPVPTSLENALACYQHGGGQVE
jgi:hypothetical protein